MKKYKKYGRFSEEQVLEKIPELPRWAQEFIREKQIEAASLQKQIDEFVDEQKPSDISWQYLVDNEHFVPQNSHVKFYHDSPELDYRASIEVSFKNIGKNGRVLDIRGTRKILIEPRTANNVYIIMEGNQEHYEKEKQGNEEMS